MHIEELTAYNSWVVRRADKIPLDPKTGERARVDDASTWSDYSTAVACCKSMPDLGLGFILSENDPYAVIDLDKTEDIEDEAQRNQIIKNQVEIFNAFNTYSERSPSGNGIHIWCKGSVACGKKRSKVEVYSSGRHMTVTFDPFKDIPIADCQELLTQLWQDMGGSAVELLTEHQDQPQTATDEDIIERAANASNGELFKLLWLGNWKDHYPTQSEADFALVDIIAFYTDNAEQVARIYWNSPLFLNSPKRTRKAKRDYLFHPKYGIVKRSFDRKLPLIDLKQLAATANPIVEIEDSVAEPEESKPAIEWTLPPGLIGDVTNFIYCNAVNPVKEVALSAAIAYLAGVAGRAFNISATGLNQYMVLLAKTAGGKEAAASGMEKITYAVRAQVPPFEQFIGPADIASPQALVKHLATESRCFISHKGEFGFWLQKLCHKYAKANETSLRGLLLDLFTKSGHGQVLRGSIYSDKAKNVPSVDSPALTLFGESTPQEFYKALDEDNVTEGLIARLTVVECPDDRPPSNPNANKYTPDEQMVWRLGGLAKRCLEMDQLNTVVNVQETEAAIAFQTKFKIECLDKVYADRDSVIAQIWSRAHLKLLRLGALIAVGCNTDYPIVDVAHYEWAHNFILHGVNVVANRFESGMVGDVNLTLEQRSIVARCIRKFCDNGYSNAYNDRYAISREMYEARVITQRFIHMNVVKHAAFRKDHNTLLAFKNMMNEFVENGYLVKVDMARVKNSGRNGIAYYVTKRPDGK